MNEGGFDLGPIRHERLHATMNPDRLWLRFVRLALLCALLPGFGLATLMVSAWTWGLTPGLWYLASIQTHAFALLMGWGGAMVLGVALHFLPRLRGVKLIHAKWVPMLFWLLALGLTCRIVAQPLLALLGAHAGPATAAGLNGAIAGGLVLQAVSILGLLTVLIATFRTGRPLKKNKGFKQIAPLLAVTAFALAVAQLAWLLGAGESLAHGRSLAVLPVKSQWVAVDLMLFGCIAAIGIAMSSRLFPLTFRMQLPHPRGLQVAAWLLAVGVMLTITSGLRSTEATGSALMTDLTATFYAGGLLAGAFAVRIFARRKPIQGTAPPYRISEDPAAVGVLSAYVWMVCAAAFLIVPLLARSGIPTPVPLLQDNLARHAIGLGFMTLLIISVGWKMLPGFAGGQPRGRRLIWGAVWLGNLAVLLRITAAIIPGSGLWERTWHELLFPFAGLAALAAIINFAIALKLSFRSGSA